MKQYFSSEDGTVLRYEEAERSHSITVTSDNFRYTQILREIEAGEAEIVPYVEPEAAPTAISIEDRISALEKKAGISHA